MSRCFKGRVVQWQVGSVFWWASLLPTFGAFSCGNEGSSPGRTRGNASDIGAEAGAPNHGSDAAAGTSSAGEPATSVATESEGSGASTDHTSGATGPITTQPGSFTTSTTSTALPTSSTDGPAPTSTDDPTTSAPLYTPVEEPPPGLSGCGEHLTVGATSCTHRLRCDQQQIWTNCLPGDEGEWQCSCLNYGSGVRRNYVVPGLDAESVCGETYVMCLDGEGPGFADRTCEFEDTQAEADACSRNVSCYAEAEIQPGLVVTAEVERLTNYCYLYGDVMGCQCGSGFQTFQVYGADGTTACKALDDFCITAEPDGGEYECRSYGLNVNTDSCQMERLCGRRVELDDQGAYTLANPTISSAWCQTTDDETTCACNGPASGYFRMTVSGEDMLENCRTIDAACNEQSEIEVTGPLECPSVSLSAPGGKSCSLSASCGLGAKVGDNEISVIGDLSLVCSFVASGEWTCRCASGINSSEAFTTWGADGFEVCDAAKDTCSEMVVGFDPNYYYYSSFEFGPLPPVPPAVDAGL